MNVLYFIDHEAQVDSATGPEMEHHKRLRAELERVKLRFLLHIRERDPADLLNS